MSENQPTSKPSLSHLSDSVRAYVTLLIEDTKLNVTEKLTRLLAAVAVAALLTIFITCAVIFVSIALGYALSTALSPLWSFIIIAGIYILLMVVLVSFRTKLVVNPIARFISRLILDAPQPTELKNDKSASVSK